jgi:hypothetical protein
MKKSVGKLDIAKQFEKIPIHTHTSTHTMPKRAAEATLEQQVMEMVDSLKPHMSDGSYLDVCSALKENHDHMEEYNETVEEADRDLLECKSMWQSITGNWDVLLPHITSYLDDERIKNVKRRLRQMIKRSQATARKARAVRRQVKKGFEEMNKVILVKLRDIARHEQCLQANA